VLLGSLGIDERTPWANVKTNVGSRSTEDHNTNTIEVIQAAAFVICLDTSSQERPEQHFCQFLSWAYTNRRYDKPFQFVFCENGTSASLMEHSALGGIAMEPLHEALNKSISKYDAKPSLHRQRSNEGTSTIYKTLSLSTDATIQDSITIFCAGFRAAAAIHNFAFLEDGSLGRTLIESHKRPMQSTIQLAIQLASRRFFGYTPPSMETVSMAQYPNGRVETNPIIRHDMKRFLEAAANETPPLSEARQQLRSLAYEAAREHAKFLARASKSTAFGRRLLVLEWVRQETEPVPELFMDPLYLKSEAAKLLTSCFATGWLEGGFVYPVSGRLMVYFEVKEYG